jgi:ArsR family transcriptional regulator
LLDPDSVVGDLGCGTGRIAELLAPFARRVHGVDGSAAMVRAARTRLRGFDNVELHRASREELPLEDRSLDLALLVLVLHHLGDPEQVLGEVCRVLKPGGRVLIVDAQAHNHEEYRQQMGHVWLGFEAEKLSSWLHVRGYDTIRHTALRPDPAAKGPPLFVCTARCSGTLPRKGQHKRDCARDN